MITLKTLESATAQEVADQIAKHLLTQMKRSTAVDSEENVICAYRGSDGAKCAAGCLIADDEYIEEMEGDKWCVLIGKGFAPGAHSALIEGFQRIHDGVFPFNWSIAILDVYRSLGLDTSKIKHLIDEGYSY